MSPSSDTPAASAAGPGTRLLSVDDAAAYLGVTRGWLLQTVRARRIRCARLGRKVLFRQEHLEEFIAANEQPVTDSGPRRLMAVPAPRGRGARARI